MYRLFDRRARFQFGLLLLFTVVSGFLEILGVSLVIPFIALAARSQSIPWVQSGVERLQQLGIPQQQLTPALGLFFLLGILLSNATLTLFHYYAARVIQNQRLALSLRTLRSLSKRPLEWLSRENTLELGQASLHDVEMSMHVVYCALQLSALLIRCSILAAFFLLVQPYLALVLAVTMALSSVLVVRLVHRPVAMAGAVNKRSREEMTRFAGEILGAAREVRISASEEHFLARYRGAATDNANTAVIRMMPAQMSRICLECVSVAVVVGLLLYMHGKDGSLANGLPLVSAYAVAGLRIVPTLQLSLSYYLQARFHFPSLLRVTELLEGETVETSLSQPVQFSETLELENVTFAYDRLHPVLDSVSLVIPRNSRVAFVGESGVGKTTLVDLLLTLRQPDSGCLKIDGLPLRPEQYESWRRSLGYVPQSIYLLDASLAENVAFGLTADQVDQAALECACQTASLSDFIESLPQGYATLTGERGVRLSGGQCQRVGIARALYHDPAVVVFDEATSALDSATESNILTALEQLKGQRTLIVIAHRLTTVWDFDCLFVLEGGRLVAQGSAPELMESCPTFQRLAQRQRAASPGNSREDGQKVAP